MLSYNKGHKRDKSTACTTAFYTFFKFHTAKLSPPVVYANGTVELRGKKSSKAVTRSETVTDIGHRMNTGSKINKVSGTKRHTKASGYAHASFAHIFILVSKL